MKTELTLNDREAYNIVDCYISNNEVLHNTLIEMVWDFECYRDSDNRYYPTHTLETIKQAIIKRLGHFENINLFVAGELTYQESRIEQITERLDYIRLVLNSYDNNADLCKTRGYEWEREDLEQELETIQQV